MSYRLLEVSVGNLLTRTITAFPATTRRQHAVDGVSVRNMDVHPAEGALIAKATVRGSEGDEYSCIIEFKDVQYDPPEESDKATFVSGGKEYTIAPISRTDTTAKVGCNCLDFKFRFSYYNNTAKALHGDKPFLYTRVPGSNRPPANPTESPGICKHIIDFADKLSISGLIQ